MEWRKVSKMWMCLAVVCALFWGASFVMADGEVADPSGMSRATDYGKDLSSAILLISTLTGLIKTLIPKIPVKLVPYIPMILGVMYGTFIGNQGGSLEERLMHGVSFGLSAMGAYRAGKVTTGKA
jgi:hypothetical protein